MSTSHDAEDNGVTPPETMAARRHGHDAEMGPTTQDIDAVLADSALLRMHFQPIIDLQRGRTAGYEALARFPALLTEDGRKRPSSPDLWFAAADATGRGSRLEALALNRALGFRSELPSNTFMSINVSPHLLATQDVQAALSGDLRGVVVELTEHVRNGDERILVAALDALRERGALVALDDAGSGYAGLRQVAVVRPSLVKLDRSLVDGVDLDPAKLVLARLLGTYAGELDAWLLAEGIETEAELNVFVSLGVPLAQGYLLGRPQPFFESLDPQLASRILAASALVRSHQKVASLVSPVATRQVDELSQARLPRVVLDDTGRPVGLELAHRPSSAFGGVMTVHPVEDIASATARAMSRPEARRWDPLVLTGSRGQVLGLVTVDALVLRLAELQQVQDRADVAVAAAHPGPADVTSEGVPMKKFACGDVVPGCPESFIGSDDADIMTQVAAHAASAHGVTDLDAELIALVESHIHSI